MTTDELRSDWLIRVKPNSRTTYRYALDNFTDWLARDPLTATQGEIQRWIHHLSETKGMADSSVRTYTSAVTSFLDYALSQRVIEYNPAKNVKRPQGENTKRKPLTMDQLTKLLEQAAGHSTAATALIWLMLSGCRVSEACNADIADLTDHGITVTVKGGDRETKPLDAPAMRAVQAAIEGRTEGPILLNHNTGQRIPRKRAWNLVRTLAKKADIKRAVTDHELRNTAASLAAEAGATIEEIQAMLGHKEIRTTQRYMADRNRSELAARAGHYLGDAITQAMETADE